MDLDQGLGKSVKFELLNTSAFHFPKDHKLLEEWFRAIPRLRKDYEANKQMRVSLCDFNLLIAMFTIVSFKVCIHHFKEEDIDRTMNYHDGLRPVTVARDRISLKKFCIFPNCPSYLSEWNSKPKRLCFDDKEQLMMESAYSQSITDNEETVDKFLVNSLSDLISKLNLIDLRNGWIAKVSDNNPLYFIKLIISETGPFIHRFVLVNDDLFIQAFDNKHLTIPLSRISINYTRHVEAILDEVDKISLVLPTNSSQTECSINNHIKLAIRELESAINLVDGDSLDLDIDNSYHSSESLSISFHFLVGQLRNLINSKSRRRYNILTQVFSLKIHGISPACYRLIQSSNCLILPHERNLISIKNTLGIEGDYFKILKETTSKFINRERHVILQMDEVHIRSDASYKGGKVWEPLTIQVTHLQLCFL